MSFLYNTFKNAPAIGKKIKQVFSKKQPTITGVKPTSGNNLTRMRKLELGANKLEKDVNELVKFRNQKSKELFKDK